VTSFDLVLRRTQYPTLSPRLSPIVPARPPLLPVLGGTNSVTLGAAAEVVLSRLRGSSATMRVSTCPPITGATLQQINLGNPPASWLEGLGGVAGTWGLVSLAGLAVAATGGAAIPAVAFLKPAGAIGLALVAGTAAGALRQATLESASRRIQLSGSDQIQLIPLGDSICVYQFPRVDPSPPVTGGGASIALAATVQETSSTVRAVATLPDSLPPTTPVAALWGNLEVNLSPGQVVEGLGVRLWSGIASLPALFDPPGLLVDLRVGNSYAISAPVAYLGEPTESFIAAPVELVTYRHQLIWAVRPIRDLNKKLTLPASQELILPPKPPSLVDGSYRVSVIWRQPTVSLRSEIFVSEQSAQALDNYLRSWPQPPTDVQITKTGRTLPPDRTNSLFVPVRGRHWNGVRWRRYYWPD
jgi:hypothetical protein